MSIIYLKKNRSASVEYFPMLELATRTGSGNSVFIDELGATVTPSGVTVQGSNGPTLSTSSAYFTGSNTQLVIAHNANYQPQSSFQIEFWFNPSRVTGVQNLVRKGTGFIFYLNGTDLRIACSSTNTASYFIESSIGTVASNNWYHVVLFRNASGYQAAVNGVVTNLGNGSTNINTGTSVIRFGQNDAASNFYAGYIAMFRYINGEAPYTVEQQPEDLTVTANTVLMLKFNNANIVDNIKTNHFSIVGNTVIDDVNTRNGLPTIKFDGSGDRVLGATPTNLVIGTSDFTFETWVRPVSATPGTMIDLHNAANNNRFACGYSADCTVFVSTAASIGSTTTALTVGQWNHVAIVRSSGVMNFYINGQIARAAVNAANSFTVNSLIIGSNHQVNVQLNGNLHDLRLFNVAKYSGDFTPV